MPSRSRVTVAAVMVAIGAAVGMVGCFTYSAFSATKTRSGDVFAAAADWTAPTVSGSGIDRSADSSPGTPGYVRPSTTYQVYANVTDTGNPASGTSSVAANVSAISSGQTALALSSGSYTAGGVSYN